MYLADTYTTSALFSSYSSSLTKGQLTNMRVWRVNEARYSIQFVGIYEGEKRASFFKDAQRSLLIFPVHVNVIRFSHTKFPSWHFVFFELFASLPSCGTCQWRAQLRTSSAEHVISWAGAISARDWGLLTGESIDGHLDRQNYLMCELFRWVGWWKNALDGWKDGQIVACCVGACTVDMLQKG